MDDAYFLSAIPFPELLKRSTPTTCLARRWCRFHLQDLQALHEPNTTFPLPFPHWIHGLTLWAHLLHCAPWMCIQTLNKHYIQRRHLAITRWDPHAAQPAQAQGKIFTYIYQGNVAKKTTQGRLYCFRKVRHVYRIPYDQAMLDCIAI